MGSFGAKLGQDGTKMDQDSAKMAQDEREKRQDRPKMTKLLLLSARRTWAKASAQGVRPQASVALTLWNQTCFVHHKPTTSSVEAAVRSAQRSLDSTTLLNTIFHRLLIRFVRFTAFFKRRSLAALSGLSNCISRALLGLNGP